MNAINKEKERQYFGGNKKNDAHGHQWYFVIPVWSIFVWCSFPSRRVSIFPPYLQRFRRLCGVGRGTYAYVFGSFVWTWSSNKVLLRGSNPDVRKSLVWSHLLFQNKHVVVFGHVSSLKRNWGAGWQFEIEFAVLLDNQPNVMFDMVWYYTIVVASVRSSWNFCSEKLWGDLVKILATLPEGKAWHCSITLGL
jgi:hypothetical protein